MISQKPDDQKPAAGADPRTTEAADDPNGASSDQSSSTASNDASARERAKAHADKAQNEDG